MAEAAAMMEIPTIPGPPPPPVRRFPLPAGLLRLGLIGLCSFLLSLLFFHHRAPPSAAPVEEEKSIPVPDPVRSPDPVPGLRVTHPSPQRRWDQTEDPAVYMPTASGRVSSALYGSVRTGNDGLARFHEGVDISPTQRDRQGRALDDIYALADGKVAYANRVGGNSSYGVYVVLAHDDALGQVYTLYSHLDSVESGLRAGMPVRRGQRIGRMGHSSTLGIPVERAHLHLELCVMLNPDFPSWSKRQKLIPDHGAWHGFNLFGFDPLPLLLRLVDQEETHFSFAEALSNLPAAWTLVVRSPRRPRYFDQYPGLWRSEPHQGGPWVVEVSESGIPLSGRNATAAEIAALGTGLHRVLAVDAGVLGRNGVRHVIGGAGNWRLGSNGIRWLEMLTYPNPPRR